MCVISIANAKGGTGKTTTTFNLGAALAKRGKRVLAIDNDQQGSLTTSVGNAPTQISTTLANLIFTAIDYPSELGACLERCIIHGDEMDLIPANQKLAGAVTRLVIMQTSGPMFIDDAAVKSEFVLRNIIDHLRERYDYILIDCGRTPDLLMVNALAAADSVLIPVQARYLDSDALPQTIDIVNKVRQNLNPALKISGILLTMFQRRTTMSRSVRRLIIELYKSQIYIFSIPIPYSVAYATHPAYGESIFQYAPTSDAAQYYSITAGQVIWHG